MVRKHLSSRMVHAVRLGLRHQSMDRSILASSKTSASASKSRSLLVALLAYFFIPARLVLSPGLRRSIESKSNLPQQIFLVLSKLVL